MAFAVFGWELDLRRLAAMHTPVQPPPSSKPSFVGDANDAIGHADLALRQLLRSLQLPLDARVSIVLTSQTDDSADVRSFRAFVAVEPFFSQAAVRDDEISGDGLWLLPPLCVSTANLTAAFAAWTAANSDVVLPDAVRAVLRAADAAFFLLSHYERYPPEVLYRNGVLAN